ncbi:trypsin-like peptidase domain-containing protein [Tautonia marina]|uniref:trypsin-like peptidase domain-containing protein n=1 Tax=Tautonia marina TaxID=2653855 RepID=UPI001261397A|nr:trypsin-like peptidase domain-containing protein [Tautonia marina]
MRLDPDHFKALHDAVVDAFSPDELEQFLRREMGDDLDRISSKLKAHGAVSFDVIRYYENRDRVTEFISKAGIQRSDNAAIRKAVAPIPMPDQATATREKLVQAHLTFQHFGPWLSSLSSMARAVGRLEVANASDAATGLLVGSDLLLTNFHVIEDLMQGDDRPGPSDSARDRFILDDFLSPDDGLPFQTQRIVSLAANDTWHVRSSPPEKLDFALVRLAERVGDELIQQGSRQIKRDPLKPAGPSRPPVNGEPILVLQYPRGERLKIALGSITNIDATRGLIEHSANTEPGSSGAPILTSDLKLLGLHWGHERRDNCASLMSAITQSMGGSIPE